MITPVNKVTKYRLNRNDYYEDDILVKSVWHNGDIEYYDHNGDLHNLTGPAAISKDTRTWYKHGCLHRICGPAVSYYNGNKAKPQYWIDGRHYSEGEFKLLTFTLLRQSQNNVA